LDEAAASGTLNISKIGRAFEYRFDPPLQIRPFEALELEYLGAWGPENLPVPAGDRRKKEPEQGEREKRSGAFPCFIFGLKPL
jgi:hypothetical protein